jgi:hypothetical protein
MFWKFFDLFKNNFRFPILWGIFGLFWNNLWEYLNFIFIKSANYNFIILNLLYNINK